MKLTVTGATHKSDTSAQSYDIVNSENLGCTAAPLQHYLPSQNSIRLISIICTPKCYKIQTS